MSFPEDKSNADDDKSYCDMSIVSTSTGTGAFIGDLDVVHAQESPMLGDFVIDDEDEAEITTKSDPPAATSAAVHVTPQEQQTEQPTNAAEDTASTSDANAQEAKVNSDSQRKKTIGVAIAVIIILALALGLGFALSGKNNEEDGTNSVEGLDKSNATTGITGTPTGLPTLKPVVSTANFPTVAPVVSADSTSSPTTMPTPIPTESPTSKPTTRSPTISPTVTPFTILFHSDAAVGDTGDYFTTLFKNGNLATRQGTVQEKGDVIWKTDSGNDDFKGDYFMALNVDDSISIYRGTVDNATSAVEVWSTKTPNEGLPTDYDVIPLLTSGQHISFGDGPMQFQDLGIGLLQQVDGIFLIYRNAPNIYKVPDTAAPTVAPVTAEPTVAPVQVTAEPTAAPVPTAPVATNKPTIQLTEFEKIICEVSDCSVLFEDSESYQAKAHKWLTTQDTFFTNTATTNEKKLQRYALACFYYSTNGVSNEEFQSNPDPWMDTTNWLAEDVDECQGWHGITCVHGFVEGIDLPYNGLSGIVPIEVSFLKDTLKKINIRGNFVANKGKEGHEFLRELTNLVHLDYNDCWFGYDDEESGIPHVIAGLTNLEYYDASYNSIYSGPLNGTIFKDLQKLTHLGLDGGEYESEVPLQIARLPLLRYLSLEESDLSGDLYFMTVMNAIEELNLGYNPDLEGEIPTAVGTQNTKLVDFDVSRCGLSEKVPKALGMLTELRVLDVFSNDLTGNVPSEIGLLNSLEVARFQKNKFNGIMPPSICGLRTNGTLETLEADCGKIGNNGLQFECSCCTKCHSTDEEK